MIEISVPDAREYALCLKKLNRIFRRRFQTLIPKLYAGDTYRRYHRIAKENGELLGVVASIPRTVECGEAALNARGIGMVGTVKKARGKGVMSALLNNAIDEARRDGVDFLFLDGMYERYARFGFVPCGVEHRYRMSPIKAFRQTANVWRFEPLGDDSATLEALEAVWACQSIKMRRAEFGATLRTWHSKPVAIYKNSELCGHLVRRPFFGELSEICLRDANIAEALTQYALKKARGGITVCLPPHRLQDNLMLSALCERHTVSDSASFVVLNFRNVIEALLRVKSGYAKLAAGSAVVEIIGNCKLKIDVGKEIAVVPVTCAADATLTYEQALKALFSHSVQLETLPPMLQSWFPLPLNIPNIDNL